jgi:hypothetical protein
MLSEHVTAGGDAVKFIASARIVITRTKVKPAHTQILDKQLPRSLGPRDEFADAIARVDGETLDAIERYTRDDVDRYESQQGAAWALSRGHDERTAEMVARSAQILLDSSREQLEKICAQRRQREALIAAHQASAAIERQAQHMRLSPEQLFFGSHARELQSALAGAAQAMNADVRQNVRWLMRINEKATHEQVERLLASSSRADAASSLEWWQRFVQSCPQLLGNIAASAEPELIAELNRQEKMIAAAARMAKAAFGQMPHASEPALASHRGMREEMRT